MLRVLPAELGEVGVAADAVLEVVLGLAVAREVDGLGLGVQVHHEGDDRRGEVAAHVVRDVALPVVLVDLHDAVDRVLFLLQVVVASTSRRHSQQDLPAHLELHAVLVVLHGLLGVVAHVLD